jgi:hypothetical protein
MALTRHSNGKGRFTSGNRSVTGARLASLLLIFGVDVRLKNKIKGKPCHLPECPRRCTGLSASFWDRPLDEIVCAYETARREYMTRIKQAHPDRGGDASEAAYLNRVWAAIQRIYRARGIST